MADEVWRWSAAKVARAIREKEVSAAEVVGASLECLDATNAASRAIVQVAGDALDRAREADAAVARGGRLGPLHGVPVTFKINSNQVGYETTHGVGAYAGHVVSENDPQVQSLLDAGGIASGGRTARRSRRAGPPRAGTAG